MKMSKLYNILFLTAAVFFDSCSDEGMNLDTYKPSLTARYLILNSVSSSESIEFEASSNLTKSMTVRSTNTPWAFSGMDSWLHVSPTSGASNADVTVTAEENKSGENTRTNIFAFASSASDYPYSKNVTVTQKYATPYLNLSTQSLSFNATAQQTTVNVSSNITWTASCDANWVKVTKADDAQSLTVKAEENTTGNSRTATIYIKKEGVVSKAVTLTQAVATIDAQSTALNFDNVGGTKSVSITSDASWTVTTSDTWLQVTPQNGSAGTSDITISATPINSASARTGYVYLKIGSKTIVSIKVTQAADYLTATPQTLSFESFATSKDVAVSANVAWKVASCPEWLQVEKGSGKITVAVADNPLTTERKGQVKLTDDNANPILEAVINVTQAGKYFGDILASMQFEDKAGNQTLVINTDGTWTTTTNDNWITITPQSGTAKDSLVTISVTENNTGDERTGSVSVTVGETTKSVVITQKGKYFKVDDNGEASIPSKGGSRIVTFSTNCPWTAESTSAWVTLSPTSGSETGQLSITASENASTAARTDTTYIRPTIGQQIIIITTQAGKYLKVDKQTLYFFTKGGTSAPITVDTDAEYEITKSDDWITVKQEGNVFTVAVTENSTDATREGKVTVKMLGLQNGEECHVDITVIQRAKGEVFTFVPFEKDEQWGDDPTTKLTIVVTGFGDDEQWNP